MHFWWHQKAYYSFSHHPTKTSPAQAAQSVLISSSNAIAQLWTMTPNHVSMSFSKFIKFYIVRMFIHGADLVLLLHIHTVYIGNILLLMIKLSWEIYISMVIVYHIWCLYPNDKEKNLESQCSHIQCRM